MSLDLGELLGSVDLIITPFERKYSRVVDMMSRLGVEADKAGAQTGTLDEGLAGVAESSNAATAGLGRTTKVLTETGLSASDAAVATRALALAQNGALDVTTELGAAQSKLAQSTLRAAAAQARLEALQAAGGASAARLAGAEASVIAANDRVAISEERVAQASILGAQSANRAALLWGRVPAPVKAAGLAFLVAAGFAIKGAIDYQKLTVNLVTGAGEQQRNLSMVSNGMLHMAGQVGDSASDLAKAMFTVESAGFHGAAGLILLKTAAEGAKVDNAQLAAVVDVLTSAMKAYHEPASSATRVTNTLIASAAVGKLHLQDLASSMGNVIPIAASLHIPLAQVGAAIATMTAQGTDAARATTSIRFLLSSLAGPAGPAIKAMKEVGLSVDGVQQSLTNDGLPATLQMITDAIGKKFPEGSAKYVAALKSIMGGTRGWTAATELTGKNMADLNANLDSVNTRVALAGNKVSDWADVQKNFNVQWSEFIDGLEAAGIHIGQDLLPAATLLLRVLKDTGHAVGDVVGFFDHDRVAAIALATVLAATLAPAVIDVVAEFGALVALNAGAAMYALIGPIVGVATAFVGTEAAAGGFGAAMAALDINPVTLSILALAVVVGGIVLTLHHFAGGIHDTSISAAQFTTAMQDMAGGAHAFVTAIGGLQEQIGNLGKQGEGISPVTDNISNLDDALTSLVTSGHADQAAAGFNRIEVALIAAGVPMRTIVDLFPQYNQSLAESGSQAASSASGVDNYGNAVSASAKQTQSATKAIQAYSNALDALNDPVFAFSQALQDEKSKQDAATKAIGKYGANSRQAKLANLDLAQSSVSLESKAEALRREYDSGTITLGRLRGELRGFVNDGLLTRKQAAQLGVTFGSLVGKSQQLGGAVKKAGKDSASAKGDLSAVGKAAANLQKAIGPAGAQKLGANAEAAGGIVVSKLVASLAPSKPAAAAAQIIAKVIGALRHTSGASSEGASLTQGFAAGMTSDNALVAVGSAAATVITLALNALHKHGKGGSPYKLFMPEGAWATGGFALGMISPAALATLDAASKQVIDRTVKSLRAARKTVDQEISSAIDPTSTNVPVLASIFGSKTSHAVDLTANANIAKAHAAEVGEHATHLANALKTLRDATGDASDKATIHSLSLKKESDAERKAAEVARANNAISIRDLATKSAAADKAAAKAKKLAQDAENAAKAAGQAAATAAQNLVQQMQSSLDSMQSAVSSFQSDISQGLTGDNSLSSIWDTLTQNGDASVAALQGNLGQILATTENFSNELQRIAAEGGSESLVSQLAGMGAEGQSLAQQLLNAGPGAISLLSSTVGSIQSVADAAGDTLSQTFYGAGVTSMEKFVEGLMKKFPELKKALHPLLAELKGLFSPSAATTAVPGFANGVSNFGGGLAWVGERGPELVKLPRGANVYPHGSDGASLMGMDAVVTRLEAIEQAVLAVPAATGSETAAAMTGPLIGVADRHAHRISVNANKKA